MYYIKHLQIFALNWHITQYACECIYIYIHWHQFCFQYGICLQNNMFISNFCLHPGPFNCLRPPGLPASAESIHWALWQHAHVWLAQDFADLELSGLEMEIQIKHGWFLKIETQAWIETLQWWPMFMELNGVIVAIHLWRDDLKQLRCHNVPQFYSLTHLKVLENWKNLDHCTSRSRLLTPNRAHLSNSWQHLTYESHSMIGIL